MIIFQNKKIYIWIAVYAPFCAYVIAQYFSLDVTPVLDAEALHNVLLRPQKMLFNNNLFFAVLLFAARTNYLSNEYLVRGGKRLAPKILLDGMLLSLLYTAVTFVLLIGLSPLVKYYLTTNLITGALKLGAFCLIFHLIYSAFYLISKNHLLAIFAGVIINMMLLLIVGLMEEFGAGGGSWLRYWNRWFSAIPLVAALIAVIAMLLRKKDFL
ncbi:MAG: hypothetical protein LBL36_02855 [Clostridiales Family XIII bacterium]|jgi:hypothetical protein|nr:hypothetical protein [Clostridiales Family XIII bacterium]